MFEEPEMPAAFVFSADNICPAFTQSLNLNSYVVTAFSPSPVTTFTESLLAEVFARIPAAEEVPVIAP